MSSVGKSPLKSLDEHGKGKEELKEGSKIDGHKKETDQNFNPGKKPKVTPNCKGKTANEESQLCFNPGKKGENSDNKSSVENSSLKPPEEHGKEKNELKEGSKIAGHENETNQDSHPGKKPEVASNCKGETANQESQLCFNWGKKREHNDNKSTVENSPSKPYQNFNPGKKPKDAPNSPERTANEQSQTPLRLGKRPVATNSKKEPFGGEGGEAWDDGAFTGIKHITLFLTKTKAIIGIQIEYDQNGQSSCRMHGSNTRSTDITKQEVKLEYPNEVLTHISGYTDKNEHGNRVIQSLSFHTNKKKTHGPFGKQNGKPFPPNNPNTKVKVVGFYGRTSMYLDAIGLHTCALP